MQKLDEILLDYALGDAHVAEGLKLTYMSLVRGYLFITRRVCCMVRLNDSMRMMFVDDKEIDDDAG